jgi:hypothetical protein
MRRLGRWTAPARGAVRWKLAAALAGLAALGAADLAQAATTWQVTTQQDGAGTCAGSSCTTLRGAVAAASPGDTVMLPASTQHYLLTLGEIQITKPLTIAGAAAKSAVIDAGGHSRVFEVTAGVSATQTVTFRAVTITGGKLTSLTGAAPGGAGVAGDQGAGNLVFRHTVITGNRVNALTTNAGGTRLAGGGGILQNGGIEPMTQRVGGNLTLINSVITNNHVTFHGDGDAPGGGAIKTDGGNTTVIGSVISGNTVNDSGASGDDQGGGGIENRGHNVTVTGSTISGNTITTSASSPYGSGGGGINNQDDTLRVVRSTISGNTANMSSNDAAGGGGVYDGGVSSVWVNTTVSGNRTTVPAGTQTGGGGIYRPNFGTARLTNVTIVRNSSTHAPGGGIFVPAVGAKVRIKNTIVALNRSGAGGANCGGDPAKTFVSVGHNLENDSSRSCGFKRASDILSATPHLGALAKNGGPTMTVALERRSPAIDRIPLSSCMDQGSPTRKPITTDQRGRARPDGQEHRCDIGAFESRLR